MARLFYHPTSTDIVKKANPLIESFQRTTLGPIRNFDIVTSEFIQILHTGHMHWVCVSSIGCTPGIVKLYDSLYHDIIEGEVTEQVKSLMADSYIGLVNVAVQQQLLRFQPVLFMVLIHKTTHLTYLKCVHIFVNV